MVRRLPGGRRAYPSLRRCPSHHNVRTTKKPPASKNINAELSRCHFSVSYLFSLPCIPHRIIVFYLLQNHWTPLSRPPYGAEIPRHDAPAYSRPHRARHRPEVARL
ncbi:hypothetical protein BC938DRAFT_482827 [Jimgerdemannia flammicorona]|uniref:Uncharacterized protein n=1 Tax=Jimgerdemannia flammicorona TaxID=994334 RepID=A0A433QW18_9FUNG|nr:hypothetical protein BC938DRAFT_482827 [Jimgerdemannia flammicorona]